MSPLHWGAPLSGVMGHLDPLLEALLLLLGGAFCESGGFLWPGHGPHSPSKSESWTQGERLRAGTSCQEKGSGRGSGQQYLPVEGGQHFRWPWLLPQGPHHHPAHLLGCPTCLPTLLTGPMLPKDCLELLQATLFPGCRLSRCSEPK